MKESLLGKLVLVLSRATPEELAAIYHFATGKPRESAVCGVPSAEAEMGLRDDETTDYGPLTTDYKTTDDGPQDYGGKAKTLTSRNAASKSPYVFRRVGRHWQVVFGGGQPFYLEDTLAAKCSDYLLHHPNNPITSFDLEVEVRPEKGAARARNSIQVDSDARALREYREELSRLRAEKQRAQAAGQQQGVARLEEDIQALESELRGGGPADAGERAYDNVRKAFSVLRGHLGREGPGQRAFGEHLRTHLSIGFECLYSQPEGRIWV